MISIPLYSLLPASNLNIAASSPTISLPSLLSMRTRFASLSPVNTIESSFAPAGISRFLQVSRSLPSKLKVLVISSGLHGVPGISPISMPSGQDVGDRVGSVVGQDVGDVVGAGDGPVLDGDFVGSFVGDGVG